MSLRVVQRPHFYETGWFRWGGLLVESIKGRQDNVVGFPLATLEEVLKTFGRSLYDFARV